jgi:hypothetical protein
MIRERQEQGKPRLYRRFHPQGFRPQTANARQGTASARQRAPLKKRRFFIISLDETKLTTFG